MTYLFPAGAERGKSSEITAAGAAASWPVKAWVSGSGVTITAGKEKGKLSVAIAADAEPGVRWLRLFNDEGASPLRPFLVGTLPEVTEVESNDDLRKPQTMSGSSVVNGRLEKSGDVDHFAVSLKKGQILVASLMANESLASPMDAVLQLLSPDGAVIAENHDTHGLDPQVVFTSPGDGTYLVRVFAFPAMPDSSIRFAGGETYIYRLTLTTGPFADHAFPLAVTAKEPGNVELFGWNLPSKSEIAVHFTPPTERLIVPALDTANPVAVRVERHRTVRETEPNDQQKPQTVELPITISGRIDSAGDIDVYQFVAKKGQRYLVQVEADRVGSPLDATLRITDDGGKTLTEVDDVGRQQADPETTFSVPADGAYRVEVRDLYKHGGMRYVYRLRIVPPEPDYSLTIAADQFTATPGQALEIPVTIQRQNGFAEALSFKVEGLPDGVTANFEPASADAKAKTVKLKLTAKSDGFSGPIRIVGSASQLPEPDRRARTTITGFKESTDSIWLTVRPAKKK